MKQKALWGLAIWGTAIVFMVMANVKPLNVALIGWLVWNAILGVLFWLCLRSDNRRSS